MKWLQNGNLAKLVAFFVIAVVITCTVSFAANGWQSFIYNEPDSDKIITENNSANNKVDENNDGNNDENLNTDIPVVQPGEKYYHPITGLETSVANALSKGVCVCLESSDPLYGISSSYLTIEFPTEYGNTRFLCFTDDAKSLGKLGSLAPSRGYISNLASYFGGILLSYGTDDAFKYDHTAPQSALDFKATSGYCYTEYNSFVYTNGDLVNAFLNNSGINQSLSEAINLPYNFSSDFQQISLNGSTAESIAISFSDTAETVLNYSQNEAKYLLYKGGMPKKDLLNDKTLTYDNVFVLYANTTTYETEDSTQLIVDTYTGGTGVYATMGKYIEITWEKDASGNLVFYNTSGEKLTVNRGTSYIAFAKASSKTSVQIS